LSAQPTTLHCPTCGAAISSDATQCQYCGTRLATVSCPGCFGLAFLGSKFCPHCGKELAQAPESPTALPCPRCKLPMEHKTLGGTPLLSCDKCAGLWIGAHAFEKICADREQQAAVLGEMLGPAPTVSFEQNLRYLPCPQCRQLMNRVNFAHSSGVIIDICKAHGIWFDRDELRKIVEFIRAGGIDRARAIEYQKLKEAQLHAANANPNVPYSTSPSSLDLSLFSSHHGGDWADVGICAGWAVAGLLRGLIK